MGVLGALIALSLLVATNADVARALPAGSLSFDAGTVNAQQTVGRAGVLADVDGDGHLDLLVDAVYLRGSASGPVLASALNIGPGDARDLASYASAVAAGDFDGDGYAELVLADPGYGTAQKPAMGEVHIVPGSFSGPQPQARTVLSQGLAVGEDTVEGLTEANDGFGTALAVGDFNRDGYDDLAVGTPNEDVGARVDAGAVNVLYGSPAGLSLADDQLLTQLGDVLGVPEAGDRFGAALVAADFDADGYDDLAIGVPGESIGAQPWGAQAGVVSVIGGSAEGLSTDDQEMLSQLGEMPGSVEAGDHLGAAMAAGDADGDGITDLVIAYPAKTWW